MRKFGRLALCAVAVMILAAGCSKKDTSEETTAAAQIDRGSVTSLGEYTGVEVTRPSTEVTDEELEQRIQSILDANPERVEVTRAAKDGDIVNIDYVGMKDGVAFDGGTAQGYDLELGSGTFIDGFEDGLIGAKTGDECSLNLTFPETYSNEELAGQAVVFDVTVNSVMEVHDAVLDDAFVQRMSDLSTVDEFRADTLADMQEEKETQADEQVENDAFQAVIDATEFSLNEDAVEQQYQTQLAYYTSMVEMYGMTLEQYVSLFGMTQEEFEEQLRISARQAIQQQLVVEAIAEKEGFVVDDEDRQGVADLYGTTIESLQSSYGEEALNQTAMIYKVVHYIKDNAVVK
ncbi:MAG: trigger factor [Clostridiales bacterium]|nr:trigger factor [Clostridiales bacterium]